MAFLIGFALEMPSYILLACLLLAWIRDFRCGRAQPSATEDLAEDPAG